ncbi:unnamed protein product [Parajaminaea phylloscopi]
MSADSDNLSELAEQRISDAQTLFGGRPSLEIFGRSWAPDATFEDPICIARGWQQYSAQWWAMRLFSTSTTTAWRVVQDDPQEVRYVQKQKYGIDKLGFEKEMISTVVMKLDESGRIKHFEDRWDHKEMPGAWAYPLRRLNALTMPWIIGHPKDHPDAASTTGGSGGRKKEL